MRGLRASWLCLLLSALAHGASGTLVTGTLKDVGNNLLTGTCVAKSLQSFAAADGSRVAPAMAPVVVTAGSFSATFVPGDSAAGGPVDYSMVCALHNVRGVPESVTYLLRIPTSAVAVDLNDVIISAPAGSSYTILWQQLAQNGARQGQYPVWNGSSWVVGAGGMDPACTWETVETGACGPGSFYTALTWAQIEAL